MSGSSSVKERMALLNRIDKILFNSKWSQKRFFINIENEKLLKQKTSVCYQSTNSVQIDFTKKKKINIFCWKIKFSKGI